MEFATIISFSVVVLLLVISPGPNGVLIAKTVPTSGKLIGFANVAGFITAFYIHGTLSILGISLILVQSSKAFFIVKMLGAAYLCWIGIKALREAIKGLRSESEYSQPVTPARRKRSFFKGFAEGLLTNVLNPKVAMFYLAAFPQFISPTANGLNTAMLLVTIHALINLLWFTAMILLLAQLTKAATNNNFQRWVKGVTGVVFVAFGIKLASLRAV